MDCALARKLLDILIDNGTQILRAGFGLNWAEASFFDVIRLLREESSLKGYFLDRVGTTFATPEPGRLDSGTVPSELIELVAHELRWSELQVMAQRRIADVFGGDAALAIGDFAHSLVAAYEDDWRDREFYLRYRQ
ncbi:hypothetical protein [Allochromatium vinosum]|uniref:hypothetical protein n=1 Tax=Allochromatium vinosum TaxID=1049 RepID=UPI00190786B9|nr:hypothetical protein [Allochromatium vinosum]MBK1654276.1 hypothetical protein [Allochromatium vinosum]